MTNNPEALLLPFWKKQLDASLRMMETINEGSMKVRQLQLGAAAHAHAELQATRKAVAAATQPAQLVGLQARWLQSSTQQSLEYWRSVYQALMETDAAVAQCACSEVPIAVPEGLGMKMIDDAFKQWLRATQQLYAPAGKVNA